MSKLDILSSLFTSGRVTLNLDQLVAMFGRDEHPHVPKTACEAEVIFEMDKPVIVLWRCHGVREVVEKMAPKLLEREEFIVKETGGGYDPGPRRLAELQEQAEAL